MRAQTIARFSQWTAQFQQRYEMGSGGAPTSAFAYARGLLDEALARVLSGLPPRSRILDAGCGTGHYLRRMRDLGHDVIGVEPAAPMRAAARALAGDVPILDAVISDLPFQDRRFDLVVAIEVLRYLHVSDVRAALGEMMRITRPGGQVFFTVLNRLALNSYYAYYAVRRALTTHAGVRPPVHGEFTTAGAIRQDLLALGATEVAVLPWVIIPFVRPMYRVHPIMGRLTAGIMRPLERLLSAQRWTAHIAGGLIVVARHRGEDTV
ncbi:MAG TPA: class I SAM-dependent methyltransferase [bacterium]